MKVTAGLGWGKYAGDNSFDNPLSFLSKSLESRPGRSSNYGRGGNLSYDKWFAGDAAFFGGLHLATNDWALN